MMAEKHINKWIWWSFLCFSREWNECVYASILSCIKVEDKYLLLLFCLIWWNTLITSLSRLGLSSILAAKKMHAIAQIYNFTQVYIWNTKGISLFTNHFFTKPITYSETHYSSRSKLSWTLDQLHSVAKFISNSYALFENFKHPNSPPISKFYRTAVFML